MSSHENDNNSHSKKRLHQAAKQQQFLDVISKEEATFRFEQHLDLKPLGKEEISLFHSLHRILAKDVAAEIDVTSFDRSNVDGFAIQAADTFGASEEDPVELKLNAEVLSTAQVAKTSVEKGTATTIATGAIIPRGADAVVMVEETELLEEDGELRLLISRAVSPGAFISYAGTDIARQQTVLRSGTQITSREIGVLAAIGRTTIEVFRKPKVALISTGDEIVPLGEVLSPGTVYDSNQAILAAAVSELGGIPLPLGIARDDLAELHEKLQEGMKADIVLMSGGTSKGAGDLSYRVVSQMKNPGILAHGVALKPGKPICLAVTDGKPVVILPGFPTSAVFTFHEFVAPIIRLLAGFPREEQQQVHATVPHRIHSARGRTEYLLVSLIPVSNKQSHSKECSHPPLSSASFVAYPLGKGSGSVTTFSYADGFITIEDKTDQLESGEQVQVTLLGEALRPADLIVVGSHCVGLDFLLGELHRRGFTSKTLYVGSRGGLTAAHREECDLAGFHLKDPESGIYNEPFITPSLKLVKGYRRMQGILVRNDDVRFQQKSTPEVIETVRSSATLRMVNRNSGSGTRVLIDELLQGEQPDGYAMQPSSHNAVAAAIQQHRADWGIAIRNIAEAYQLAFHPIQEEHYDFAIPRNRLERPAVQMFLKLLKEPGIQEGLRNLDFPI